LSLNIVWGDFGAGEALSGDQPIAPEADGPWAPRYEQSFPGPADQLMVKDNVTGLIWQGCPAGLSGSGCLIGTILTKTRDDAQTYCNGLNWGGQATGWRLPEIKELSSIVESRNYSPAIDTTAFPASSDVFWSSSPAAFNTVYAYDVDFSNGHVSFNVKTGGYNVRCVRG